MESNTNDEHDGHEGETAIADHLDGVADGCGCTEVWEHLSEQRAVEE